MRIDGASDFLISRDELRYLLTSALLPFAEAVTGDSCPVALLLVLGLGMGAGMSTVAASSFMYTESNELTAEERCPLVAGELTLAAGISPVVASSNELPPSSTDQVPRWRTV